MFKHFNRGIFPPKAIGIIVVLAIVVSAGILAYQYYYVSKQETKNSAIKSELADWKTYTNNQGDYSIFYPDNAKIDASDPTCVWIQNDIGSIYINNGFTSYSNGMICGSTTGLGINSVRKSENIKIGDQTYLAEGYLDSTTNQSFLSFAFTDKISVTYRINKDNYSQSVGEQQHNNALNSIKQILSTLKSSSTPTSQLNITLPAGEETSPSQSAEYEKYIDISFGFAFYYPQSWKISETDGVITLTNFGPYYDDRILISRKSGSRAINTDAKFGTVTYYYDNNSQSWQVNQNTDFNSGIRNATPSFYTISNFPVFSGVSRWKTNIVPISTDKFLIVNITGSGFTGVLDPFTETISERNANVSSETISNLIKTQMNNEHGSVINGWLEGTTGNWVVAETTKSLSGYSGSKFSLKFNDKSTCVYVYSEKIGDFKSFLCSNQNTPSSWGHGDRVRIYGKIGADQIDVSTMEIVTSLPINQW